MNAYDKAQIIKAETLNLAQKDAQKIHEACVNGAIDYEMLLDSLKEETSAEYLDLVVIALNAL